MGYAKKHFLNTFQEHVEKVKGSSFRMFLNPSSRVAQGLKVKVKTQNKFVFFQTCLLLLYKNKLSSSKIKGANI